MPRVDYARQAETYDRTRAASPTLVGLIARLLGEGGGRGVLDVAGGTGNYARALAGLGFRPTIVDREVEMVRRSIPKIGGGRQVVGNALALPFRSASFDAVAFISALHQMPDQRAALVECARVLNDGPLLVQAFTEENTRPLFVFEYFPGADPPPSMHMPAEQVEAWLREIGFRRVEVEAFAYRDSTDGTLASLHTSAERVAAPEHLRNTSFWDRLDEEQRRVGLEALERDLRSGVLQRRVEESTRIAERFGHGTVFAAWA